MIYRHVALSMQERLLRPILFGLSGLLLIMALLMTLVDPQSSESVSPRGVIEPTGAVDSSIEESPTIHERAWLSKKAMAYVPLPDLAKEMLFLGGNKRPDAPVSDTGKTLLLAESQEQYTLEENASIYLQFTDAASGSQLLFSRCATPLKVTLRSTRSEGAELMATLTVPNMQGDAEQEQEIDFFLPICHDSCQELYEISNAEEALSTLRVLPPDQLIEKCGGASFEDLKGKHRLVLDEIVFLTEPLFFTFDPEDSCWKRLATLDESRGDLLAKLDPENLCFTLWDRTGRYQKQLPSTRDLTSSIPEGIGDLFKHVLQRTEKSIFCQAKGKNFSLKQGDWLLNEAKFPRILHGYEELRSALKYESTDALMVFEGMEKKGEKPVFTGWIFDPLRTKSEKIELAIEENTPSRSDSSNKNPQSDTIYDFEDFLDDL